MNINLFNLIDFFKNKINCLILYFMDINKENLDKLENRINIFKTIKLLENFFKENNIENHLYYNISSFLFGDFIEINFKDNKEISYIIFKNDTLSSDTLYCFYKKFENTKTRKFTLDLNYNNDFFYTIMNYLIYNDNKDNIGTLEHNSKSWLYLKDKDGFNNQILLKYNYYKLKQFKTYLSYFKIKVLDYKISAIIDIIHLTLNANISENKNEPLHKLV